MIRPAADRAQTGRPGRSLEAQVAALAAGTPYEMSEQQVAFELVVRESTTV